MTSFAAIGPGELDPASFNAIDVTRPLPFTALPRPMLGDLAKDLLRKREAED